MDDCVYECAAMPPPERTIGLGKGGGVRGRVVERKADAAADNAPSNSAIAAAPKKASHGDKAATTPQQQQQQGKSKEPSAAGGKSGSVDIAAKDMTRLPKLLDKKFLELDEDCALRPTIIQVGESWDQRAFTGLLASASEMTLGADEQETEKKKAFDLLDALSRSGSLPIEAASLHVIVASTHCFDKTLINTIVQANVNPIEKVERSTLIIASTIHNQPVTEIIADAQLPRVTEYSPMLFLSSEDWAQAKRDAAELVAAAETAAAAAAEAAVQDRQAAAALSASSRKASATVSDV